MLLLILTKKCFTGSFIFSTQSEILYFKNASSLTFKVKYIPTYMLTPQQLGSLSRSDSYPAPSFDPSRSYARRRVGVAAVHEVKRRFMTCSGLAVCDL